MTYEEWMNEIENYGTRFERFLEEWWQWHGCTKNGRVVKVRIEYGLYQYGKFLWQTLDVFV